MACSWCSTFSHFARCTLDLLYRAAQGHRNADAKLTPTLLSAVNACREQQEVTAEQLASGLASLGYELPQSELAALMRQMDLRDEGRVGQPAFVASQLDWRAFQRNYK